MGTTYLDQVTLTTMTCGECGVVFGVPAAFFSDRQRNGKDWYCPNGHRRRFREEVERPTRRGHRD